VPDGSRLHQEVAVRLAALDQRYTAGRRALVEVLGEADRPLTIAEILEAANRGARAGSARLPQSSAYRSLTALAEAGVVRRLAGADDLGRFELAEDLSGQHHHHLVCASCGVVADVRASPRLERALSEAGRVAADETGFEVTDHRIDLVGRCSDCR
jgi:Fur family ferric uptake transcriptional regulator